MAYFETDPYKVIMSTHEGVLMHDVIEGRVTAVDRDNKTVDVELNEPYYPRTESSHFGQIQEYGYKHGGSEPVNQLSNIPIVYNCKSPDQNPANAFNQNDDVLVLAVNGSYFCVGFTDKIKPCGEYALITLDGYGIMWDLASDQLLQIPGAESPFSLQDPAFQAFITQLEEVTANALDSHVTKEGFQWMDCRAMPGCEAIQEELEALEGILISCNTSSYPAQGSGTWYDSELEYYLPREKASLTFFGQEIDVVAYFHFHETSHVCLNCPGDPNQPHCSADGTLSMYRKRGDMLPAELQTWESEDFHEFADYADEEGVDAEYEYAYRDEEQAGTSNIFEIDGAHSDRYAVIVAVSSHIIKTEHIENWILQYVEYSDYEPNAMAIVGKAENGNLADIDPLDYEESQGLRDAVIDLIEKARQGLGPQDLTRPRNLDVRLYK